MNNELYNDIAVRTNGDIYIGVVGPVRTGKSTFIKRFMESLVIDNIEDVNQRNRAIDELPQSADGKTIMTTEPKFIPANAVKIKLDGTEAMIRMIDCVGYLVDDAIGHTEGDKPRLVNTPWSSKELSFQESAELGTHKVISEHSTIGIVVTTDGSITDIPRSSYIKAEERVIKELQSINKPFVIVLNCVSPESESSKNLALSLQEKYNTAVICCSVMSLNQDGFKKIIDEIIMEFPITRIDFKFPKWMSALDCNCDIMKSVTLCVKSYKNPLAKMRDYEKLEEMFAESDIVENGADIAVNSGSGVITLSYTAKDGVYFDVLSNVAGLAINDDYALMCYVKKMGTSFNDYERIRLALDDVKDSGYGIVSPDLDNVELERPEIMKKSGQFGVRLKAQAPTYHIIKVDVKSEISPIVGSEQQSLDLLDYLTSQMEQNNEALLQTNMFGRPIGSLVKDDIYGKVTNMPIDVKKKLRRTVGRIVNESKGGVLCILL